MTENTPAAFSETADPDWDMPLSLRITPALLVHALMENASGVHTGWESCVDESALLSELVVMDDTGGAAVRLVEQEFADEAEPDAVWHDWAVEVRIGRVVTTGHFSVRTNAPPLDWNWHLQEAERTFERACVLLGRRVRRGLAVEEPLPQELPPRASRH
ncbi:hypothetical protein [uncultured Thiohalocapsa sp.]|jgi:hypothetical protein|uniref:hypothetical protein n=1 Tax=uncultured Thiohalocapsa sp. TaxID=768990 RepID=UPI0025E535B9|nr:hypothetical protein [uncultured Thiohalocapsa sp.]